jgi:hypothetical protein
MFQKSAPSIRNTYPWETRLLYCTWGCTGVIGRLQRKQAGVTGWARQGGQGRLFQQGELRMWMENLKKRNTVTPV